MTLQAPKWQLPRLQERGQAQVLLGVAGVIFLLSQTVEKRKKRGEEKPSIQQKWGVELVSDWYRSPSTVSRGGNMNKWGFSITLFHGPSTGHSRVTPAGSHWTREKLRSQEGPRGSQTEALQSPRSEDSAALSDRQFVLVVGRLRVKKMQVQRRHRGVQRTPGPPIFTAWLP